MEKLVLIFLSVFMISFVSVYGTKIKELPVIEYLNDKINAFQSDTIKPKVEQKIRIEKNTITTNETGEKTEKKIVLDTLIVLDNEYLNNGFFGNGNAVFMNDDKIIFKKFQADANLFGGQDFKWKKLQQLDQVNELNQLKKMKEPRRLGEMRDIEEHTSYGYPYESLNAGNEYYLTEDEIKTIEKEARVAQKEAMKHQKVYANYNINFNKNDIKKYKEDAKKFAQESKRYAEKVSIAFGKNIHIIADTIEIWDPESRQNSYVISRHEQQVNERTNNFIGKKGMFSNQQNEAIRTQLILDQIVTAYSLESIELNDKLFMVNGVIQSKKIHKKYKKMFLDKNAPSFQARF